MIYQNSSDSDPMGGHPENMIHLLNGTLLNGVRC
jgi:hypothetical protein